LGHVLNKTLKDIVVKTKNMTGFRAPYLPGWDCHGLPIEHQVVKELGSKAKSVSKVELRKMCREYASKFVEIQKEEFKRLGVFGEWENAYRTMDFPYQAQIVREFAKIVEKGYVYRTRRAIHWCISCRTALAEAEIEYADHRSPSLFVAYPVTEGWEKLGLPKADVSERFAVIWTTTPWTLPASMAIAFDPKSEYVVASAAGGTARFVLAKERVASMPLPMKIEGAIPAGTDLSLLVAAHPWLNRKIPFLPGDHVTMDTGTGLVHTAPGHGEEDYEIGVKHAIEIYSPVEGDGRFEAEVEHFGGEKVFEANPKIIAFLKGKGRLIGEELPIDHAYPHCWRCKHPVVFRATEQWFLRLSNDDLRARALSEIDRVTWVPAWGRDRIYGMIENRPDWCLSRQRTWGIPLPAFRCKGCQADLLSAAVANHVADLFEERGADVWFEREAMDLLPSGTNCPKCGKSDFEKGSDILDVWFDSGVSHAAVLEKHGHLGWPSDLYLEGSDQHRGWFHSALLESLATRGKSPFKEVITHGFLVDGQGRKMSKSLGNVISAQDTIRQSGAEILRLWVATADYRDDLRLSKEILDRIVEAYRRIRNTARFCLGNTFDFQPDRDAVPPERFDRDLDRWAYDRLALLVGKVREAYENYEFHIVISAINEFCVVELSSLYLDISKDSLYCDDPKGIRRRSAQTVLFETARVLAELLAPILPVTAEEVWDFLPPQAGKADSVHLAEFPELRPLQSEAFMKEWDQLLAVRSEVSKALEKLRQGKTIGQSLEAAVEVVAPEPFRTVLEKHKEDLAMLFIVSRASVTSAPSSEGERFDSADLPGLSVFARAVGGERCERCWAYAADLGRDREHSKLCGRCAGVVRGMA
jgi:isoleucyl-tRNA synthetase